MNPVATSSPFVTVFGGMLASWYATRSGTQLTEMQTAFFAALAGLVTPWIHSVLGSLVAAVTAVNDAVAANVGGWLVRKSAPKVPAAQAGQISMSLLATLLVISVLAAGCGVFGDTKPVISRAPAVCTTPAVKDKDGKVTQEARTDPICAEAFDLIAQGNVLLIAVDKTIGERFSAGIWTKDQALSYFRKTGDAGAKLDQASLLFMSGTYTSARALAESQKTILLLIQKEVAAAAAKSGEAPVELLLIVV